MKRAHNFIDRIGFVKGRLTVIGHDMSVKDKNNKTLVRAICLCSCGNIASVNMRNITHGNVNSCGCLKKEQMRGNRKQLPATELACFNKLLREYSSSAKQRKLLFNLTTEQFTVLINGNCHYCGNAPSKRQKSESGLHILYNGIDRVDNAKGYIFDNCVSCCTDCNLAKRAMSEEYFYQWVARVYHHIKDRV